MDELFKRYKYLMYEIIDKYSIESDIAKDYFEQMLHCYMYFEPDVKFEEFFSVITTILVTFFDVKSIKEMNL